MNRFREVGAGIILLSGIGGTALGAKVAGDAAIRGIDCAVSGVTDKSSTVSQVQGNGEGCRGHLRDFAIGLVGGSFAVAAAAGGASILIQDARSGR